MAANDSRLSDSRRVARYAFGAIVCVGLVWLFAWRPSFRLDREDLLWLVAYGIIAVPVLVVEQRVRKRIGPHEGFELVALFVSATIRVIAFVGLVLLVLWMADNP